MFSKKKYFRLVELGPKFGIWGFSAIFALFFRVPKNLIYINNAFNGYSNVSFQVLDEDDEELIDLLGDLAADVGENQSQPPRTTPTTTEPSTTSQTFSAPSQVTPRSSIRPTTPLSRSQRKASQMD